ncbi:MAG: hypothetical protein CO108_04635 [Deltaproteobacteria bacterium CG_4_9_14_3_um_filter_63_12]|nr:MAG: hypothetical protein CO108_04635 [Deltaproteobacteria bacterium CG_4_9_14_3_um_filter_63_12]
MALEFVHSGSGGRTRFHVVGSGGRTHLHVVGSGGRGGAFLVRRELCLLRALRAFQAGTAAHAAPPRSQLFRGE